ncbi:cyclin-I-like [Glandiceps talaboti]
MASIRDRKKLQEMLTDALEKERTSWKENSLRDLADEGEEIGPSQRDGVTRWLCELNFKFGFSPDTFMLSTTILDNFLTAVKARPKYLKCIAVSCFFLGMKMKEEDEVIPTTQELIDISDCGCTVADVLRMERIILDKLQWNINLSTPLDFLHVCHAMLVSGCPHLVVGLGQMSPSRHLSILTGRLQQCVGNHRLASFRGSILALALLSLELEILVPDWLAVTIMMQRFIKADNESVIHCRETIISVFMGHPAVNTVYMIEQQQQKRKNMSFGSAYPSGHSHKYKAKRSIKRKVQQIEVDEIYDSIKRLYNDNEETTATQEVIMVSAPSTPVSCRRQLRQDKDCVVSTCPPLQIVGAN